MLSELWRSDGETNKQVHAYIATKGGVKVLPSSDEEPALCPNCELFISYSVTHPLREAK